jgi:hypothetical protein
MSLFQDEKVDKDLVCDDTVTKISSADEPAAVKRAGDGTETDAKKPKLDDGPHAAPAPPPADVKDYDWRASKEEMEIMEKGIEAGEKLIHYLKDIATSFYAIRNDQIGSLTCKGCKLFVSPGKGHKRCVECGQNVCKACHKKQASCMECKATEFQDYKTVLKANRHAIGDCMKCGLISAEAFVEHNQTCQL